MITQNLASSRYAATLALLSLAGCELITAPDHDLIGGQGGSSTTTTTGGGGQGGSTTTTTTTGGGGSGGGTGGGPECTMPSDCPAGANSCQDADCDNAGMCAIVNKTPGTACTEITDGKCDASGECVECLAPADCPILGSACTNGVCVSPLCMNGMKDTGNGETDVDCGGATCPDCANLKDCTAGTDCSSGFCNASNKCEGCGVDGDCAGTDYCLNPGPTTGVCTLKLANGTTCTGNNVCGSGACVSITTGPTMICCDTACNNGCKSCDGAFNGGTAGTCLNIVNADPKNNCNDECSSGCNAGACVPTNEGNNCGMGPSCTVDTFQVNPQDTCVAGDCNSPAATDCGLYTCDSGTNACRAACTAHTECDATSYCGALGATETDGLCHAKKATAAVCAINEECANGTCTALACN
jgi:hypothetical protein